MEEAFNTFKFLTVESLQESDERYKESVRLAKEERKRIRKEKKARKEKDPEQVKTEKIPKKRSPKEDSRLQAGKILPHFLGDYFPKRKFAGKMMEEIDPYYKDKRTFVVIDKSKTIFRFSSTKAFFLLSPFHPLRAAAIRILTHPTFSFLVLATIITNCVFMTLPYQLDSVENTFTAIYSAEFLIKAIARGLIIYQFTYLRDAWNWLDFFVIMLAYAENLAGMIFGKSLGNFSALRSLRVLRALKTVNTIPGMKTVVSALVEAIIKLRDAVVLTLFMLSIFALVGLQLYRGTLLRKCVREFNDTEYINNITLLNDGDYIDENYTVPLDIKNQFYNDPQNWYEPRKICNTGAEKGESYCPIGYICFQTDTGNPDFNYTNYDNFPFALLCSFRLMTQDYWENLYQIIIRANGDIHVIFFMTVIFFGSFYLINVILAIVAMSYDDVCRADLAETEEEEAEKKEEEEKREQFMEELDHEVEATSIDLDFKVPEYINELEYVTIKSCGDLPKRCEIDEQMGNDQRTQSLQISNNHAISIATLEYSPNIQSQDIVIKVDQCHEDPNNIESETANTSKSKHLSFDTDHRRSSRISDLKPEELEQLSKSITNPNLQRRLTMFNVYEEENRQSKKEMFLNWFLEQFCSWTCCPCYNFFTKCVGFIVLDPFMELFITICIVLNTAFMALDTPSDKDDVMNKILTYGNYFFMAVFTFEAVMKMIALNPRIYFSERWNIFDCVVVIMSLLELCFESKTLSMLRTFRLLRVFKLAKSWQTMNLLFTIIGRTLGAIGNLCIVLGIIIFIFAVVGMEIFGQGYNNFTDIEKFPDMNGQMPRWNFHDFVHSFMIVFRVLCGEYIESMWNCWRVNGFYCVPFFLLTMVLGNLVILNLFIALLLSSFGSESLQQREDDSSEINKLQEAFDRIYRFAVWNKINFIQFFKWIKKRIMVMYRWNRQIPYPEPWNTLSKYDDKQTTFTLFPNAEKLLEDNLQLLQHLPLSAQTLDATNMVSFDKDPEINEANIVFWHQPFDCLPDNVSKTCNHCCCTCWFSSRPYKFWWWLRCQAFKIVDHKYFEVFILSMIVLSSLTLTLEDKDLEHREWLKSTLEIMDKFFTIIFTIEMILKWMALGLTKYLKDPWCWLDFVIVMIALISLGLQNGDANSTNIGALKALRTLRALRPLRAVSRWEGMRIVVNALIQAIPSILNVSIVCLVFWFIFSIIGMQFFGGKFYKCVYDENRTRVSYLIVPNKTVCLETANMSWVNSKINFDSVPEAYLALLQVATFKGWIEIMQDAVDIAGKDYQPIYNRSIQSYAYFVLFIVFGAFFTLNLFIGVIIEYFNVQKKRVGGSLEIFMTDDQKKYYNAMKKMSRTAPQKSIPRPESQTANVFYNICTNQKFDIVIMCFIMLNTVVMCIEHHNQSNDFKDALDQINKVFILIFTGECIIKLIALRWYYFKSGWNVFDFIIVVFSIVFWILESLVSTLPISPIIIRVVRLFRISRVLRLVKSARGIRTLLFSLIVSLPSLFNIALLLMLIMFIYSIVGMSFFGKVAYSYGIDEQFNFETFGKAMIILFQISTTGGWNSILDGLMNTDTEECKNNSAKCGSKFLAVLYLVSYIIMSAFVIVNMYIAVILENFSQATRDVQEGLTQDDYDLFYEIWEEYDLDATGFMHLNELSEFVDRIGSPLGIPKPNKIALALLEIPICEGNLICCVDLLDKLTKHFLSNGVIEMSASIGNAEQKSMVNLKPQGAGGLGKKIVISDTFQLQRENWAASKITHLIRNVIQKMKDKVDSE